MGEFYRVSENGAGQFRKMAGQFRKMAGHGSISLFGKWPVNKIIRRYYAPFVDRAAASRTRSSSVRCACRARHCCLRAAELCAAARAAGPFSMSFESARIILGALLA